MQDLPRLAVAQDVDEIYRLLQSKDYPQTHLPAVTAVTRREADLAAVEREFPVWLGLPRLSVIVVPGRCFLVALHGQPDFVTGQPETVVMEHAGDPHGYPAMLEFLQQRAGECADQYLAWKVYAGQEWLQSLLGSRGFRAEMVRVVQNLGEGRPDPEIRRVGPQDRLVLARLHVEYSSFYASSARQNSGWDVMDSLKNYLELDLHTTWGWLGGEGTGYILVRPDFQGEKCPLPLAYLYDIAVARCSWGQGWATRLHDHAAHHLRASGYAALVGDISADNPRALQIAVGALGYRQEWERWGRDLV